MSDPPQRAPFIGSAVRGEKRAAWKGISPTAAGEPKMIEGRGATVVVEVVEEVRLRFWGRKKSCGGLEWEIREREILVETHLTRHEGD